MKWTQILSVCCHFCFLNFLFLARDFSIIKAQTWIVSLPLFRSIQVVFHSATKTCGFMWTEASLPAKSSCLISNLWSDCIVLLCKSFHHLCLNVQFVEPRKLCYRNRWCYWAFSHQIVVYSRSYQTFDFLHTGGELEGRPSRLWKQGSGPPRQV